MGLQRRMERGSKEGGSKFGCEGENIKDRTEEEGMKEAV